MAFKRLTPAPRPIEGDPCADPRVDCAAYRAAVAAAAQAGATGVTPAAELPAVVTPPVLSPAPDLPVSQVARNALKAAGRVAGAILGGQRVLVPDAERDRRLAICATCPHYDAEGNAGLGRCRLCGCTRKKASFATERCPDGRWGTWDA